MDRLNDILAATFPGRVGRRQGPGPRLPPQEGPVHPPGRGLRRRSKPRRPARSWSRSGRSRQIRKEIRGWDCCRPPGLKHDLVFLELQSGKAPTIETAKLDEPGLRRRAAVPRRGGHRPLRGRRARVRAERVPPDPVDRVRDRRAVRADRPPALQPGVRGRPGAGRTSCSTCPSSTRALLLGDRSRRARPHGGTSTPARQRRRPVPRPGRLPAIRPGICPVDGRRTGREGRDPAGLHRPRVEPASLPRPRRST